MKQTWRIHPKNSPGEWHEIDCEFAVHGSDYVVFCDADGDMVSIVTLANTFLVSLLPDDYEVEIV